MTSYIGVDPGLGGALALWTPDDPLNPFLTVVDMPTLTLKKAGGTKRFINYAALAHTIRSWVNCTAPHPIAVVERVSAMPGQGIASAFDFGRSFGAALTACHACDLRVEQISPSVWKHIAGIPVGAGKDQSRARAMNLFPAQASLFARVKDDGRADAALLAWCGPRKFPA